MSMVVNLVLDQLVLTLQNNMNIGLTPDDLSYVDVFKKGLLQTSKTSKNIQIGVTGGDHEDPNYKDAIVSDRDLQDIGIAFPAREVGGGQAWWRRGVVRIECFFIRERLTEDEAHVAGYDVLGRVQSLIESVNLNAIVADDFGERPQYMFCFANTYFESGGPPKSFIFRGKVYWTCLTERP